MEYSVAIIFFLVGDMRCDYECSGGSSVLTEVKLGIVIMSA